MTEALTRRSLKRIWRLGLIVVLIAAFLVAAAVTSSAGADRTRVHYFHAFRDGRIAPGIHVVRAKPGYCWTTSGVEGGRDTWRCFLGNLIYDPCFSSTRHGDYVLCPYWPWNPSVVQLRLARSLPTPSSFGRNPSLPWGIWTANGKRCVHYSGATTEIRGKPILYECRGGGYLAGLAHRSQPTWTIFYSRSDEPSARLQRVGITDAWW